MALETGVGGRIPTTRGHRGNGVSPRLQIAELQRARLLSATALVADELGWSQTRVAHIAARARVSRRTFYELFENREDCLLAVLEDVAGRIEREIAAAAELAGCGWRERVRGGLLAILSFFEREPALARVCVVQALQGGSRVLMWRGDVLARLAAIVDEGRGDGVARSRECTTLTAEGLVGAAFAIVHARLLASERGELSLVSLRGELMSMIVLPYHGPAAARAERDRSLPSLPQGPGEMRGSALGVLAGPDPLREVPMRLTYRTARVLDGVAASPGASNRLLADHAGITDQGQISKLLARLQRLGLLANSGRGQAKGEPNAWTLTPKGQRVANSIAGHSDPRAGGESA